MTFPGRTRALGVRLAALSFLAFGAVRFFEAGLVPATRGFTGDFGAAFPTAYFVARLRPDAPTDQVWVGWNYGPMLHFLTAPLLLVPRWSMVPPLWASINFLALAVSFMFVYRLENPRRLPWPAVAVLAGLWLLYQPLATCFAQGNIEIIEMALILAAVVWLPRWKGIASGVLVGVAAMAKFLPIGFLFWFLIRRQRKAFVAGVATIAVVVAITSVTLGWKNSTSLKTMSWASDTPIARFHELSVTSLFLHRTSLFDYELNVLRWFPTTRGTLAARAGGLTSALLAFMFSAALFLRRRQPVSSAEIAVLFMTMFMILPWNHDYYYVFGLMPLSILFLRAARTRNSRLLTVTFIAYACISPPIPYGLIDRTKLFALPFAYVYNYHDVPVIGGLLLWGAATQQMFAEPAQTPVVNWHPALRHAAAACIVALTCLAAWALWPARHATDGSASRATVDRPVFLVGPGALALSPDETRMAYLSTTNTGWHLCVAPIDKGTAQCFERTENAEGPFFAPNGQWIGFFANNELRKVSVATGTVTVLASVERAHFGTWDDDDMILFASRDGIVQIPATGGAQEILVPAEEGVTFASPVLVGSGKEVLFSMTPAGQDSDRTAIVGQSLSDGRRVRLLFGDEPRFDRAAGRLIYTSDGRVLQVSVDATTFMPSDNAVPLASNVVTSALGSTQFATGCKGSVLFASPLETPVVRRTLVWVDRNGRSTPLPIAANAFATPRLSPDGHSLAVAIRDIVTDIWTFDLMSGTRSRQTFEESQNQTPVWLGNDTLSFSVTTAQPVVYSTPVHGDRGNPVPLWRGHTHEPVLLSSASPDLSLLAGTRSGRLWILDRNKRNDIDVRTISIDASAIEMNPAFSGDGRYVAYTSQISGRTEVYVMPANTLRGSIRVSTDGGEEPRWRADGRELFYRHGNAVMAVEIDGGPVIRAGTPRVLFQGAYLNADGLTNYDVAADGQRFLMIRAEPPAPMRVELWRGWTTARLH